MKPSISRWLAFCVHAAILGAIVCLTCVLGQETRPQGQTANKPASSGPHLERDANPRKSSTDESARPEEEGERPSNNLLRTAEAADLVAEVTLVKGVAHVPPGLRIVMTDYVFKVENIIKGKADATHVTARNVGGELENGTGMAADDSYKLTNNGRYLIFAQRRGDQLRLANVFQVHQNGRVVADTSGRVLIGVKGGVPIARPTSTYAPLRYLFHRRQENLEAKNQPVGPPDQASEPQPKPERRDMNVGEPLPLEVLIDLLKKGARASEDVPVKPARKIDDITPEFVTLGGYYDNYQSHFGFISNDNQWDWYVQSRNTWNTLVDDNPSGPDFLLTNKIDSGGKPIRNRQPYAENGQSNVGVMNSDDMATGGYERWENMTPANPNGICYRWYESANGRIKETDVFVRPAIASDEAQFRKTMTHELGHALLLDHEDRYMAIMFPGTFRQPPNYNSRWYTRRDDNRGVRSNLDWVNANVAANTWQVARFTDLAIYSQAHANPGTSATDLAMTTVSSTSVNPGGTVVFRNVHVENRGNVDASNVKLKFYLSTNTNISSSDVELGTFSWATFSSYNVSNYTVTIPRSTPRGTYYAGWILTTDTAETSAANNTSILRGDRTTGFAETAVTVN